MEAVEIRAIRNDKGFRATNRPWRLLASFRGVTRCIDGHFDADMGR